MVVGAPLVAVDATIAISVREVGQEIQENLVFGQLAADNLWVQVGGVAGLKVSSIDGIAVVAHELIKSAVDDLLTNWVTHVHFFLILTN